MVRNLGFEPRTTDVSDQHSTAELIPHGGDDGDSNPVSKNQLLIRNLILTLQVLCIPFYLYSLPYTNLKSKPMQISKSLKVAGIDS